MPFSPFPNNALFPATRKPVLTSKKTPPGYTPWPSMPPQGQRMAFSSSQKAVESATINKPQVSAAGDSVHFSGKKSKSNKGPNQIVTWETLCNDLREAERLLQVNPGEFHNYLNRITIGPVTIKSAEKRDKAFDALVGNIGQLLKNKPDPDDVRKNAIKQAQLDAGILLLQKLIKYKSHPEYLSLKTPKKSSKAAKTDTPTLNPKTVDTLYNLLAYVMEPVSEENVQSLTVKSNDELQSQTKNCFPISSFLYTNLEEENYNTLMRKANENRHKYTEAILAQGKNTQKNKNPNTIEITLLTEDGFEHKIAFTEDEYKQILFEMCSDLEKAVHYFEHKIETSAGSESPNIPAGFYLTQARPGMLTKEDETGKTPLDHLAENIHQFLLKSPSQDETGQTLNDIEEDNDNKKQQQQQQQQQLITLSKMASTLLTTLANSPNESARSPLKSETLKAFTQLRNHLSGIEIPELPISDDDKIALATQNTCIDLALKSLDPQQVRAEAANRPLDSKEVIRELIGFCQKPNELLKEMTCFVIIPPKFNTELPVTILYPEFLQLQELNLLRQPDANGKTVSDALTSLLKQTIDKNTTAEALLKKPKELKQLSAISSFAANLLMVTDKRNPSDTEPTQLKPGKIDKVLIDSLEEFQLYLNNLENQLDLKQKESAPGQTMRAIAQRNEKLLEQVDGRVPNPEQETKPVETKQAPETDKRPQEKPLDPNIKASLRILCSDIPGTAQSIFNTLPKYKYTMFKSLIEKSITPNVLSTPIQEDKKILDLLGESIDEFVSTKPNLEAVLNDPELSAQFKLLQELAAALLPVFVDIPKEERPELQSETANAFFNLLVYAAPEKELKITEETPIHGRKAHKDLDQFAKDIAKGLIKLDPYNEYQFDKREAEAKGSSALQILESEKKLLETEKSQSLDPDRSRITTEDETGVSPVLNPEQETNEKSLDPTRKAFLLRLLTNIPGTARHIFNRDRIFDDNGLPIDNPTMLGSFLEKSITPNVLSTPIQEDKKLLDLLGESINKFISTNPDLNEVLNDYDLSAQFKLLQKLAAALLSVFKDIPKAERPEEAERPEVQSETANAFFNLLVYVTPEKAPEITEETPIHGQKAHEGLGLFAKVIAQGLIKLDPDNSKYKFDKRKKKAKGSRALRVLQDEKKQLEIEKNQSLNPYKSSIKTGQLIVLKKDGTKDISQVLHAMCENPGAAAKAILELGFTIHPNGRNNKIQRIYYPEFKNNYTLDMLTSPDETGNRPMDVLADSMARFQKQNPRLSRAQGQELKAIAVLFSSIVGGIIGNSDKDKLLSLTTQPESFEKLYQFLVYLEGKKNQLPSDNIDLIDFKEFLAKTIVVFSDRESVSGFIEKAKSEGNSKTARYLLEANITRRVETMSYDEVFEALIQILSDRDRLAALDQKSSDETQQLTQADIENLEQCVLFRSLIGRLDATSQNETDKTNKRVTPALLTRKNEDGKTVLTALTGTIDNFVNDRNTGRLSRDDKETLPTQMMSISAVLFQFLRHRPDKEKQDAKVSDLKAAESFYALLNLITNSPNQTMQKSLLVKDLTQRDLILFIDELTQALLDNSDKSARQVANRLVLKAIEDKNWQLAQLLVASQSKVASPKKGDLAEINFPDEAITQMIEGRRSFDKKIVECRESITSGSEENLAELLQLKYLADLINIDKEAARKALECAIKERNFRFTLLLRTSGAKLDFPEQKASDDTLPIVSQMLNRFAALRGNQIETIPKPSPQPLLIQAIQDQITAIASANSEEALEQSKAMVSALLYFEPSRNSAGEQTESTDLTPDELTGLLKHINEHVNNTQGKLTNYADADEGKETSESQLIENKLRTLKKLNQNLDKRNPNKSSVSQSASRGTVASTGKNPKKPVLSQNEMAKRRQEIAARVAAARATQNATFGQQSVLP
ncbi:MAG: hypothetical protein AAGI66_06775 [Cyanobacteria bacterium P01_H01_bin.74]